MFEKNIDNMLESANDQANLTQLGTFCARFGVGLHFSLLIFNGIILGVAAEAIVIVAALVLGKSPYRQAIPMIHTDPVEYNEIVRLITLSQFHFDNGLCSQPLMLLRLYLYWHNHISELRWRKQKQFCNAHGIVHSRMKQFESEVKSLSRKFEDCVLDFTRVANNFRLYFVPTASVATAASAGKKNNQNSLPIVDYELSKSVINRLRLLLTWSFHKESLLCAVHSNKDESSPVDTSKLEVFTPNNESNDVTAISVRINKVTDKFETDNSKISKKLKMNHFDSLFNSMSSSSEEKNKKNYGGYADASVGEMGTNKHSGIEFTIAIERVIVYSATLSESRCAVSNEPTDLDISTASSGVVCIVR